MSYRVCLIRHSVKHKKARLPLVALDYVSLRGCSGYKKRELYWCLQVEAPGLIFQISWLIFKAGVLIAEGLALSWLGTWPAMGTPTRVRDG